MAKISKTAAHDAAIKIAEPLRTKHKELINELIKFVEEEYIKTIPKEVLEIFKTHGDYINTSSYIKISGSGITYKMDTISVSKDLPTSTGNIIHLNFDNKKSEIYVKMWEAKDEANTKYTKTIIEIENTILTLGTHKKIEEVMPNALRFLPENLKPNMQLVLQIQPVVDKVNCLISNEKACVEAI